MQGLIAESAGTGFELIQNELAVATPLIIRMDSHAFDLGALRTGALQSAHRHKLAMAFTNQKFSPILEIHFLDSIDIIIPGTTPQVGPGLLNGMHMQIFDSFSISRLITAQGEHETCPHNFSRIVGLSSGAIGCLYLFLYGSFRRIYTWEIWIPRRSRRLWLSSARYLMGFFSGPWESEPELVSKRCVLAYSRYMAICSDVWAG